MGNRLNFGKRYEYNNEFFGHPERFHFAELVQIGELFCEAGFRVDKHIQKYYEITYVVTGRGTVTTGGRRVAVEENDVFINVPGQTHAIDADRGSPLRFCYFAFSFIPKQADPALERFYRGFQSERAAKSKDMLVPFSQALYELQHKNDFYSLMVGGYVEQMIVAAYRLFDGTGERPAVAAGGYTRTGSAAYAVMRYIDEHYRDISDIRSMAQQLGYSYTYLAHVFKESTGATIKEYIIERKMEEAKWLLRTGKMNVSQVASRFGYRSVQSFSDRFRRSVGVSPIQYQKISREEGRSGESGGAV